MSIRNHLFLLMTGFVLAANAAEHGIKVRLEMWEGCLCAGPKHRRSYEPCLFGPVRDVFTTVLVRRR